MGFAPIAALEILPTHSAMACVYSSSPLRECVLAGIGAKAPVQSRGDDPVGTFVRTEAACRECGALGTTPDVKPTELRPAEIVERRVHWRNSGGHDWNENLVARDQ